MNYLKNTIIKPSHLLRLSIGLIVCLVISGGLLYYVWGIDILEALPSFSLCPFFLITGAPCPGCGMTRALLKLGQLNISGAIQANPYSLPLLLIMVLYLWLGYIPSWIQHKILIRISLALVVSAWIVDLFLIIN